jgi:hypothetical protein
MRLLQRLEDKQKSCAIMHKLFHPHSLVFQVMFVMSAGKRASSAMDGKLLRQLATNNPPILLVFLAVF